MHYVVASTIWLADVSIPILKFYNEPNSPKVADSMLHILLYVYSRL